MFGLADKVLAYIGGGLALALAVALAWTTVAKNATIRSLEKQNSALTKERDAYKLDAATLRANQNVLEGSITAQNRSVEAAAAAGAAKYHQGAAERADALTGMSDATTRAADIAKAQQRDKASLAAAADALILESLK